ncbi:MAG: acyltransferase family protein [Xanthobacteraceae bacterium]|nr:acyltransferase family protein [Xanthobacteraceae bacterium]
MQQSSRDYRVDIDWLRAVAVVAVIGFHFQIPGFRGGFVGVDVFFVISGYLLGGIAFNDLAAGTFSLVEFWRRRARRILPALYTVVAASLAPALVILLEPQRAAYLKSIAAVALFGSNLFFWSHGGYFDRTAVDAPLLHTWSLAVEEQFYLTFPVVAVLLHRLAPATGRRSVVAAGFAVLAALSLFASARLVAAGDASTAFYLPHGRAWEFLLGVVLAIVPLPRPGKPWLRPAAKILGAVLIVVAVNSFTTGTLFPGLNALLPCLGAALFLGSGGVTAPGSRLLAAVQFVGRISYSLYLWHWPLFTLARQYSIVEMPSPLEKAILLVALVVLSWLSYSWIERPVRRWNGRPGRVFATAGLGAAALCGVSALSLVGNGALYADDPKFAALRALENYDRRSNAIGTCFSGDWTPDNHPECFAVRGQTSILLWGDSMVAHFRPGFEAALRGRDVELLQASGPHCYPTLSGARQAAWCNLLGRRIEAFVDAAHPPVVVVSAFWNEHIRTFGFDEVIADLRAAATRFAARGTRLVVLGPGLQFRDDLPEILIRAASRDVALDPKDIVRTSLFALDQRMRAALEGSGALYLSPLAAACPERACRLMATADVPMTWDFGHLTVEGSELVIRAMWPALGPELAPPPVPAN